MKHLGQILSQIAHEHLNIPTLRCRKSDSLDFHTVSVWGVEAALNAAFTAGEIAIRGRLDLPALTTKPSTRRIIP
jgi:hypothetical protein